MREIPIPFSGEMVRAILDGRKTMTRRVVKPGRLWPAGLPVMGASEIQPGYWQLRSYSGQAWDPDIETSAHVIGLPCPYGQPGDCLWVREAWSLYTGTAGDRHALVRYRADGGTLAVIRTGVTDEYGEMRTGAFGWRPSIHMPRWASRITLAVFDVRVERLQDLTDTDSIEEGCPDTVGYRVRGGPERWFRTLWDRLNAGRGAGWADNPWVWVVSFVRVQP